MSVLMLVGNIDFTSDWGKLLTTAAKAKDIEGSGATGVSPDVLYYFSPFTAMLYTMLLIWLTCIFIGLLIYIINSITQKTGYGIFVGGFLIIFDYVQQVVASARTDLEWLCYFSPVSWCSINLIDITGQKQLPDITFVLCGYGVLIIGLSSIALVVSKKQQIDVIQAV